MDTVYVIMHRSDIFENVFYTDKDLVEDRVDRLNNHFPLGQYWYQTLTKNNSN